MSFFDWLKAALSKAPKVKDPDPVVKPPKPDPVSGDPKWMQVAKAEMGQKEIPGSKDNPRIIEYHSVTTLKATEDEVPWCSSFVSWCLEKSGIRSNRNAWAQSYASFGKRLDKPVFGCIVVFRWSASSGHVGFYAGKNQDGTLKILGGNQGNQVKYANYGTGSIIAYRWPV